MSTKQITIKHNKHCIHPCPSDKKLSLLTLLISKYSDKQIFIIRANSLDVIKESITSDNVTVLNDSELKDLDTTCEILISYDLPATPALYISRVFCATEMALILLDAKEQNKLYPIETVLKRVIKQEIVEGFEYEEDLKLTIAQEKPKREYTFKTDDEKAKPDKKPYDKSKKDNFKADDKSKKWEKKEKAPNKFLGKDENGKALFSGKSGDRNHRYDGTPKDKYNAPKKVGRKISIKALKPKENPESSS